MGLTILNVYVFTGDITEYRLIHNGVLTFNNPTVMQYTITGLQAWSQQTFRLVVCTARGCGSSEKISVHTQEAVPVGNVVLQLKAVVSPRDIEVKWTFVTTPNGLLYYDVYLQGLFYTNPGRKGIMPWLVAYHMLYHLVCIM